MVSLSFVCPKLHSCASLYGKLVVLPLLRALFMAKPIRDFEREEEKIHKPGRILTHNLLDKRCALYHCAASFACVTFVIHQCIFLLLVPSSKSVVYLATSNLAKLDLFAKTPMSSQQTWTLGFEKLNHLSGIRTHILKTSGDGPPNSVFMSRTV